METSEKSDQPSLPTMERLLSVQSSLQRDGRITREDLLWMLGELQASLSQCEEQREIFGKLLKENHELKRQIFLPDAILKVSAKLARLVEMSGDADLKSALESLRVLAEWSDGQQLLSVGKL
jgi:hypothetical protein